MLIDLRWSHLSGCFCLCWSASSFWGRLCEISLCCCHPLGYDVGVVLYVVCHVAHMFTNVLISHFEVIAFMCDEMVRALFWSVVIGLVC